MADETADVSNIEQLSFGIRYVENFEAFDTFIGLHELKDTTANHIVTTIKNILLSCNFDFACEINLQNLHAVQLGCLRMSQFDVNM